MRILVHEFFSGGGLARRSVPASLAREGAAMLIALIAEIAARELGYPVVVKPARGAGCEGVSLASDARELRHAVAMARQTNGRGRLVLQRYVRGVAASVSLLADGRRAVALTTNAQSMRSLAGSPSRPFAYRGGATPLDHPLARQAGEQAVRACEAIRDLR